MGKRDSRASKSKSSKSTKHSLAKISRVGIVAKFPTMSKLGRRNHMDETTIPPFPNTRFRSLNASKWPRHRRWRHSDWANIVSSRKERENFVFFFTMHRMLDQSDEWGSNLSLRWSRRCCLDWCYSVRLIALRYWYAQSLRVFQMFIDWDLHRKRAEAV